MGYTENECRYVVGFSELYAYEGRYGISLDSISYEPRRYPWNIGMHCHSVYEIHFIDSGEGMLITDFGEIRLTAGMLYITGPDIMHSQTSGIQNPMTEYCMNIGISQTKIESQPSEAELLLKSVIDNPYFVAKDADDILPDFHELLLEAIEKKTAYCNRIKLLTVALLLKIGRLIFTKQTKSKITPSTINRRRILDNQLCDFTEEIDADKIARNLHISRRQLARIVREYYGMTLIGKVNSLRVKYAKYLLQTTGHTIEKTAELSGFNSQQYFTREFKRVTGTTPSEYRKNPGTD